MTNLTVVSAMGLINIHEMDNGEQVVMARELHEKLEIGTQFTIWFERMKTYGFTENQDFIAINQKRLTAQGNETVQNEFICKLDMAKQIAMIQRSEKGKQLREYFLELERAWNSPEQVWARALKMADKVQADLRLELQNLKPKVKYYDEVLDTSSCYTTTQIAKEIGMSAVKLNKILIENSIQFKQSGQYQLMAKYQNNNYTKVRTHLHDGKTTHSTVWTEKGRKWIIETIKNINNTEVM